MAVIQRRQAESAAMTTTRKYSETVKKDLRNDAEFRRALLGDVMASMVGGDVETGKSVLRTYVNGTIGFVKLGAALGKSPKSLMRMLSPTGNPHLHTFFQIVAYLQKVDKTVLTVHGIAA
jgi:DNA-binding phage protein